MASLVLHPRVAPPDRLRVWIGAFGTTTPGALTWTLDGAPVVANPVRPLQPSHLHGAACATGVFEIAGVDARSHRIAVREAGGGEAEIRSVLPVPATIPENDWLRVLLVSCYYRAEDRGYLSPIIEGLPAAERPHFSILMGDQVYLDLPTLVDFPDNEADLARRFERDYTQNWTQQRGLASVLHVAPSVGSPDDHEYWNNFPHAATAIGNSWSVGGRQRWGNAAAALFDAFQTPSPAVRGQPVEIDIDPLSFFILDQRSHRREDRTLSAT